MCGWVRTVEPLPREPAAPRAHPGFALDVTQRAILLAGCQAAGSVIPRKGPAVSRGLALDVIIERYLADRSHGRIQCVQNRPFAPLQCGKIRVTTDRPVAVWHIGNAGLPIHAERPTIATQSAGEWVLLHAAIASAPLVQTGQATQTYLPGEGIAMPFSKLSGSREPSKSRL